MARLEVPRTGARILGWVAVGCSALIASLWAFWGAIECFHEGWYRESFPENVSLTLAQYLSPTIAFATGSLVALHWPRVGCFVHAVLATFTAWHFRGAAALVVYPFLVAPLVLLGAAWLFGRARPRRLAGGVLVGLPLFVALASGAGPAWRVAARVDDGERGARRVAANGVDLVWAPAGLGWPELGCDWEEARRRARHLTADGSALADEPLDIWRLPTVEEVVRSQALHGENAGGRWDGEHGLARYERRPDKEPPLWNPRSQVIYWWTASEVDDEQAWIAVYDGRVHARKKCVSWGYLGFRAVREPSTVSGPLGADDDPEPR